MKVQEYYLNEMNLFVFRTFILRIVYGEVKHVRNKVDVEEPQ